MLEIRVCYRFWENVFLDYIKYLICKYKSIKYLVMVYLIFYVVLVEIKSMRNKNIKSVLVLLLKL